MSSVPLFPGLLETDELQCLLTKKYTNIPNFKRLTKEEFVQIYNNMLLARPQRQYPLSYRGRRLKERRLKFDLEAKPEATSCSNESSPQVKNFVNDRLKPPPDSASLTTKINLTQPTLQSTTSKKEIPGTRTKLVESTQEIKKCTKRPPLSDGAQEEKAKPKRVKITWP